MRCQKWITHPPDRRMTLEILGDPLRRSILVIDANCQCFKAFEHYPGIERAHRRPGVSHQFLHRAVDVLLVAEDCTAQHAALPVDVFGARVDDDVDAEWKTLL